MDSKIIFSTFESILSKASSQGGCNGWFPCDSLTILGLQTPNPTLDPVTYCNG